MRFVPLSDLYLLANFVNSVIMYHNNCSNLLIISWAVRGQGGYGHFNEQNTGLFSRLRRLFSTDVVIRNVGGNQLKTIDVDRIQAYGNVKTNALIDRFTKLHRYGANMPYNPTMNYQTPRPGILCVIQNNWGR